MRASVKLIKIILKIKKMKKNYELTGMSCGGCVANVKRVLQNVPGIEEADVQLHPQKATLSMGKPVAVWIDLFNRIMSRPA